MNNYLKKSQTLNALLPLFVLVLFFGGCSSSKYGEKLIPYKNWINWKVTFKAEISKEKINEDLLMIDKYILDYLADHKIPGARIYSINFLHIPTNDTSVPNIDHDFVFRVQTRIDWAGKQVVPGPTPPGPGPIHGLPGVSFATR